jgi:hypothetical protein
MGTYDIGRGIALLRGALSDFYTARLFAKGLLFRFSPFYFFGPQPKNPSASGASL